LQSRWYRERWGDRFRLAVDQNLKTHYSNDRRGAMYSSSIGGSITGMGADVIVMDDLHDIDNMDNDAMIKGAVERYRTILKTRVNNAAKAAFIVIGHQVNVNDISNWLMRNEPKKWTHINLRAREEGRKTYHFLSGRKVTRED